MSQTMHIVFIGMPHIQPIELMFNNPDRARVAYRKLRWEDRGEADFEVEVEDDYGQVITLNRDEAPIIMLRDLGHVHEGQCEISLAQASAQARMQRKAQSDPTLRVLTAAPPAPGMRLG